MHSENQFSRAFYRSIAPGSSRAAQAIAPLLARHLEPQSVVDFGCGPGAWLQALRAGGAIPILGLDQFDPANVELLIGSTEYQRVDLTKEIQLARRYELALCLEVGEHLPPQASRTLVRNLIRAANRVVFSAAIPGQGGVNHTNERPLRDWLQLFSDEGYVASDFIRVAIKESGLTAEPWYRYNTLFFFHPSEAASLPPYVLSHRIGDPADLARNVALSWRLRAALLSLLPVPAVTFLANCKHNVKSILGGRWAKRNY